MKGRLLASLIAVLTGLSASTDGHAGEGFYVGGLGGVNLVNYKTKTDIVELEMEDGFAVAGFAGYRFCIGVRLEAELAFRRNDLKKLAFASPVFDLHARTEIGTVMANVLYDFDLNSGWAPYVGVGVGYARVQEDGRGKLPSNNDLGGLYFRDIRIAGKKDFVAWQALGGLYYSLTCNLDVGLDYRYLKVSRDVDSQSVSLLLRLYH